MNPVNDIVCNLIETPFSWWRDEDKRDILNQNRPTEMLTIVNKKEVKKTGKSYNVNCKAIWFTEYSWLCSSTMLQKFFCWPCLLFSNKHSVWNRDGFADLLNITRSLHKHSDSAEHLKCVLILRNFEKNLNLIADALTENPRLFIAKFNENVRLNRLMMEIIIDAVLYLIKQELPLLGHGESSDLNNSGNFEELLALLISRSSLEIKTHYSKIKHIFSEDSKTIQNELITCISDYIINYMKDEIKLATFFSIQVDDTTDITQTSQCSIILKFIDSQGALVERFWGFHDVLEDRTSETMCNMLDKILEQFDYKHKLVGQCYDGSSVMSGHMDSLQKKIRDKAPQVVFVHCLTHRFNDILQQSCSKISKCRMFFASISGISTFFHHSARTSVLTSIPSRHIQTRWSCNSKLLKVILEDWEILRGIFEFMMNSKQSDNKTIQLANGFLNNMNNFDHTFLAIVFNDIFDSTDILHDILQKKSLDINYCISQIKNIREIFNRKRNDDFFKELFEKASKITELDMFKREYAALTPDKIFQEYKKLYFDILDLIIMEIDTRFQDCETIKFVCLADSSKFEEFNLHFPSEAFENLLQFYSNMFNKHQRLKNELVLVYATVKYRNITAQEILHLLHDDRDVFTEAYKLFSLILTIPSTSVPVEKSSCVKRVKTYLRNSISQERFSCLANISIQKGLLLELMQKEPFYDDIIDKFAALKEGRIDLIYKQYEAKSAQNQQNSMMEYHELEGQSGIKSEEFDINQEDDGCDGNGYNSLSLSGSSIMLSEYVDIKPFVDKTFNHEANQTTIESGTYQGGKSAQECQQSSMIEYHELEEYLGIKSEELDIQEDEDGCDSMIFCGNTEIEPFADKSCNPEINDTTTETLPCQKDALTEMEYLTGYESIEDIEVTPYLCKLCSYEGKLKEDLTQHMLVHKDISKEATYQCNLCPYETKRKINLTRHMVTHKDATYGCKFCSYKAKLKKNLTKHMLIHK